MWGWHACCSWEENNLRIFLSLYVSGELIFLWANLSLGAISRGALKGKVRLVRIYLKTPCCKVFSSRSAAPPSARQRVNGEFSFSQSENPISTLWIRAQENSRIPDLKPDRDAAAILAWPCMYVTRQSDSAVLLQLNNYFSFLFFFPLYLGHSSFTSRRRLSILKRPLFSQVLMLSAQSGV